MNPLTGSEAADDLPADLRLQILTTEHWSLLSTRAVTWNEAFSRATMFLSALSGAVVALALVAGATSFDSGFLTFASFPSCCSSAWPRSGDSPRNGAEEVPVMITDRLMPTNP